MSANSILKRCRLKHALLSLLILTIMYTFTFINIQTAYSIENATPPRIATFLNVLDYGATGDGLTDDSQAFQRAIDDASMRRIPLLIPASDRPYVINCTLRMRSNLHIRGYGATLFKPSTEKVTNLIWSSSRDFISNVIIEGLTLESVHDRTGNQHHANGLTSNVQGMFFLGITNLQLRDITIHNMAAGFKLTWAVNGELNRNITVDNLKVYNAGTALLVHSTENFTMTNSVLDAGGGTGRFQHSSYISGDTSNFLFENVRFVNSSGGGIHLYNSYCDKAPPQNMVFKNSIIDNVRTGVYLFSGSREITISGIDITNYSRAFEIWDSSEITINNVALSRQNRRFESETRYGFHLRNATDIDISNININGEGKEGRVFLMSRNTSNVRVSSLYANKLNQNQLAFANVGSLLRNIIFEDSTVVWNRATWHRISLRGVGSNAIFRNNRFINKGHEVLSLCYNLEGTNVVLENNLYMGFSRIAHPWDRSRLLNNARLSQMH